MAAAVALLGALAALLLDPVAEPMSADGRPDPSEAPSLSPRQDIQPAQFSRDLSTAVDAGIIWPDNSQPHRVLKVVYTDRITMTREDGSSYQVEKPRVEYILVPAESH